MDRKGYFNGDSDKDGSIDLRGSYDWTGFMDKPEEIFSLGSSNFEIYYGYNSAVDASDQNFIGITKSNNDDFDENDLFYVQSLDTAIDGTADGMLGRVRGHANHIANNGARPLANFYEFEESGTVYYFFDRKM